MKTRRALFIALAGCGHGPTQPPVVIRARDACSESVPARSAEEAVLARARCEHFDMLVHPRRYRLRRIASPSARARYALDDVEARTVEAEYEVEPTGAVRRLR